MSCCDVQRKARLEPSVMMLWLWRESCKAVPRALCPHFVVASLELSAPFDYLPCMFFQGSLRAWPQINLSSLSALRIRLRFTFFKDSGLSRQEASKAALKSAAPVPLFRGLLPALLELPLFFHLTDPAGHLCRDLDIYSSSVFSAEGEWSFPK